MEAKLYNQFSPSMERKLKRNERAVYRVLNVREDPDNWGKFLIPAALQIPSTDTVYDKEKDDYTPIAFIERTKIDGSAIFGDIIFTGQNMGYLFLNGNNAAHQKMYQYIELSNYNASNPNRDTSVEPLFERIDSKKEAINEREIRKLIVKAVNFALELDDKRATEVAAALGIDGESIEETRNSLEDYATDHPEDFLEVAERATVEVEKLLKDAVKKGIIKNNVNASRFEWAETKKVIHQYKKSVGKNYIKELAETLEENNPDELQAIISRVS